MHKTIVRGALQEQLESLVSLSKEDLTCTIEFLRRCFAIDPSQRATAAELLKDSWLKGDMHI